MSNKARDIMSRNIIVVEEDTSINNLIRIFLENKISCAPVVNNKRELVGIITKTDVLGYFMDIDLDMSVKATLQDIFEYNSEHSDTETLSETEMKVLNIMTPNPITAGEDTTIEFLAKTMIDHNIHRLIIKRDRKIVGVVSTLDILYHVAGIDKHE